ncbi:MAG: hypothetical protein U1E17_06095 [Geminicoccaceae bacterium]
MRSRKRAARRRCEVGLLVGLVQPPLQPVEAFHGEVGLGQYCRARSTISIAEPTKMMTLITLAAICEVSRLSGRPADQRADQDVEEDGW